MNHMLLIITVSWSRFRNATVAPSHKNTSESGAKELSQFTPLSFLP